MDINIDLTNITKAINPAYYPLLTNKDRHLVLYGSAGSGKSYFVAQKLILRVLIGMKTGTTHKFLCLRKTAPAARKSVYALLEDILKKWNVYPLIRTNKVEMSFTFPNDSVIMCSGLDDPEKLKSIHGITGVWLEEPNELRKEDFTQANLRLRGLTSTYKQIILTFNPISRLLWLYNHFFDYEQEDTTILQTTYRDNIFIDAPYKKYLESLKDQDKTTYQIYALGQWGFLDNLIYSNWEETDEFPTPERTIYGCDFGFNAPTTIVELGLRKEGVYTREILYKSGMTNSDLISWIKSNIPNAGHIYCDSAEPARIAEMRREDINARSSDKSVKDGLDFVKRQKLFIDSSSINIIKEIQTYKYKEDKTGLVLDEPVKAFDHTMDAIRYALYTHLGKKLDLTFITSGD